MQPWTWFGRLETWLLLGSAWIAIAVLSALAFGVVAKVGRGRDSNLGRGRK